MSRATVHARPIGAEWLDALRDDLGALLVLLVGLAAVCWPAIQDGRRGFMQYDASFTQIATEHLQDVALHGASWRDAPLTWPLAYGSAAADWQAGQAALGLPLRLLDVDPSRAATGYGAPPLYTGLGVDTPWLPPLPVRDRVFDAFAGRARP